MKSIFIILAVAMIYIAPLAAQSDTILLHTPVFNTIDKTLKYEDSFWGLRVYNGKKALSNRKVRNFLQPDQLMLQKYDKGRKKLIAGDIIAATGAISLGYGVFTVVNAYGENYGFDLNDRVLGYSLIGAGAIAAATGVLLFFNGQKKMKLAIDAYNDELVATSFQFGLTPNGIGMIVQF